jgi:hypothetical protein
VTERQKGMDEEEYSKKYAMLRILKSVQEYLKPGGDPHTAVYPITVPDDLLYQVLKLEGADSADKLIHKIFKMGLTAWSEKVYNDAFGSQDNLQRFIELVKKRNKE